MLIRDVLLNMQALLSLVDLMYHGPHTPAGLFNTSALWSQVAKQHSSLPPPAETCPQVQIPFASFQYSLDLLNNDVTNCLIRAFSHACGVQASSIVRCLIMHHHMVNVFHLCNQGALQTQLVAQQVISMYCFRKTLQHQLGFCLL